MASSISQDFAPTGRLISRRYVQIPKDQVDLLDKDEAWSENLSHGPRRMVNVPPEVVENFHKRNGTNLAQPSSPVLQPTPNAARPPPSTAPGVDNEEDVEGTPVSGWSQTPPRRDPDQSIQRAEQESPLRSSLLSPAIIQPKRKAPPAYVEDAPSSSAVQSEGLEMQPLEALGEESGTPVNRPAVRAVATGSTRPRATPPSAQEQTIPSTFSGTGQSGEQQQSANRQRRLTETALRDEEPEPSEQSVISMASPELQPIAPGNNQQSSATNISKPLLRTKAAFEQSRQSSLPKAGSDWVVDRDSTSSLTPTWEGRRAAMATQQEKLIQAPASSLPLPGPQPPRAGQRTSTPNSTRQSLGSTQASPKVRTPYEGFRAAYPDYQESPNIFVNALLIVERLKRDWALPEFLYDDFVRVFSTAYLQYISMSLITKADEILTAVQWYNDNVKDMQYHQKVITKDNIHDMVKAHATEAHKARNSIGASEITVDGAAHENPDEDLEDEAEQDEQSVDGQEPGEAGRKEGAPVLMRYPELHIGSPGTMEFETTTAAVGSEASLMSQVEPANEEQPSHMMTASGFDLIGQSPLEETGLSNHSQPCFSFPKGAKEVSDKLVFDKKGKEASNLIQSGTRADEAVCERDPRSPSAEVEHAMEDDIPRSRMSPELSVSSLGLEVAGVAALIEDERPEDVNGIQQGARSSPGSFASQEDLQMEDSHGDEESEDDPEAPIESDLPRFSSEGHRQPPGVAISEEMHRNGATPEVKATPGTSKSSAARQSAREPFTEVSTPLASETGSVSRKFLAPLPSSSRPPSRTRVTSINGDDKVHEGPSSPPVRKVQDRFSEPTDSSDGEEDAFDPPAEEEVVPRPRTAALSLAAFKTQALPRDEMSDTADMPVKVPVPAPRIAARIPTAIKSGNKPRTSMVPAPVASIATAAAPNQTEAAQRAVTDHRRVVSRGSTGSFPGPGKSGSPVSSERSYANVPMSKKRANETKEERSRRLKEHFRRRITGKTPSSTAMSKQ